MSATHADGTGHVAAAPGILDHRWLLSIYLIVPVATGAVLVDVLFLNGSLRNLSLDGASFGLWLSLLGGMPHIIASTFAYADGDYLRTYRRQLLIAVIGSVLLSLVLLTFVPKIVALAVVTALTVLHFGGQQTGVARALLRGPVNGYPLWKWGNVVGVCAAGLALTLQGHRDIVPEWLSLMMTLAVGCVAGGAAVACAIVWQAWRARVQGIGYLVATQAMFVIGLAMAIGGYGLFAFLLPRIVHDLTAYSFYVVHDRARNAPVARNRFYRLFGISGWHTVWFVPLVSIGLAVLVGLFAPTIVPMTLTFIHYAMEPQVWTRGTLHRQHLRFR